MNPRLFLIVNVKTLEVVCATNDIQSAVRVIKDMDDKDLKIYEKLAKKDTPTENE